MGPSYRSDREIDEITNRLLRVLREEYAMVSIPLPGEPQLPPPFVLGPEVIAELRAVVRKISNEDSNRSF
jgi:hypothetical protein